MTPYEKCLNRKNELTGRSLVMSGIECKIDVNGLEIVETAF
jgi:hypothetical protein